MQHYHGAGSWGRTPPVLPMLLAGLVAVGLAGSYFALEMRRPAESREDPVPMLREEAAEAETGPPEDGEETAAVAAPYYPVGEFLADPALAEYEDGSMELYVPAMDLRCAVYGDVADETLLSGPGLFEYAQLPGPMERNANVSIAGNRDIGNSEFLLIDQIGEGDLIYLLYRDVLYTYEFTESFVTVFQDYFEPIRVKEYPCVTLQSCTPPGEPRETQDRIFVSGRLIAVEEGVPFPEEDYEGGSPPSAEI